MSRTIAIVLFLIACTSCGRSGGDGTAGAASGGSSAGPAPSPLACGDQIDTSRGLKAIARDFHDLQSRCGLSDEELERRIEKL